VGKKRRGEKGKSSQDNSKGTKKRNASEEEKEKIREIRGTDQNPK